MRIGELARRTGATTDTIRYYERQGLLYPASRGANRYRDYDESAEETLDFIRKAQASGLTLADIREVIEISAGGRRPCNHVRAAVSRRLSAVRERQHELAALRQNLEATLARLETPAPAPPSETSCRCAAIDGVEAAR